MNRTAIAALSVLAAVGATTAIVTSGDTTGESQPVLMQATVLQAPPIEEAGNDLVEAHRYVIRPTPPALVSQTETIITSQGLCDDINNQLKSDPAHPDVCVPSTVDYRRLHTRTGGDEQTSLELCVRAIVRGVNASSGGRVERRCFVWSRSTPAALASQVLTQLTNVVCPDADASLGAGSCDPETVPYDIRHNRNSGRTRSVGTVYINTTTVTVPEGVPDPPSP